MSFDSSVSQRMFLSCKLASYLSITRTHVYSCSFRILAFEKCLVSLDGYCRQPSLYQDAIPPLNKDLVLSQMIGGLEFIHSRKLIYRDVKPENVLICPTEYYSSTYYVIKWGDFGISRAVENGKEYFTRKRQGTERWFAPELIEAMETREKENEPVTASNHYALCCQGSVKCDIFALGCVYFFFLVPGVHPFGEKDSDIVENIKSCSPTNINCNNLTTFFTNSSKSHFPPLISVLSSETYYLKAVDRMVSKDPKSRPTLKNIESSLRYHTHL